MKNISALRRNFGRSVSVAALLVAAMPAAAWAQEAPESPAGETVSADGSGVEEGEAIVVTGSRIARPEADSPNPVTSFSSENIEQSGRTNLTDLLVQSAALVGSTTSRDSSGSNAGFGAVGINLLNLRNLGTDRTLVLVNGRRHIAGVSGSASVDISTIPSDLIDRIDILTGGVSAIYGADGVSGVVNFVLKRDFEGISARGQMGISKYGDAANRYGSITAGTNFADDRGNVAVSYEYDANDRVTGFDRKRGGDSFSTFSLVRNPADFPDDPNVVDRILLNDLRYADSSRDGAIDVDGDLTPDFTGSGGAFDLGRFLPQSGGLVQGGSSTPLAAYQGDIQGRTEKHNVNFLGSYKFSDALRIFAEGKYTRIEAFSIAQPSFDFYTYVAGDNPFIPANIRSAIVPDAINGAFGLDPGTLPDGVLVSRDNFDLGVRGEFAKRQTLRGVIGVDGQISDNARYEVSYVYGETETDFLSTNYRITDRYFAALDAVDQGAFQTGVANGNIVCRSSLDPNATFNDPNFGDAASTFTPGAGSGCVPLNVFGENVASAGALGFVNADLANFSKVSHQVLSGSLSGDFGQLFELPGGPVGFALGGEYRKEKSNFVSDPLLQAGALADIAQILPERGSFDVKEAFAELNVPLLREVPFAHLLQFGAAIRFSDYSTIGNTTTWKVDGTYAPVRDLSFRATYSEAVRAPNVSELFAPQNGTFAFIDDPCDPVNIPEGTSFRQANCTAVLTALGVNPGTFSPTSDPTATVSLPGRSGGNPLLAEEEARTWTAGVVFRPSFFPGFTATFDWYDIKLSNAISTATAQDLVDLCVDQPSLENSFCANISRDPATGYVSDYLVGPANVAQFSTAGADFTMNYNFAISPTAGRVNVRLNGGYLDRLEFTPTPGAELDNDRGEAFAPKWIGSADLTWSLDNFAVNYGISYFSKTRRFTTEQLEANPDISDPRYFFFKEKWEHDLRLQFTTDDNRFTFYAGVNNLFDEKPAVASLDYPVSIIGRYYFAGVKVGLDKLGF